MKLGLGFSSEKIRQKFDNGEMKKNEIFRSFLIITVLFAVLYVIPVSVGEELADYTTQDMVLALIEVFATLLGALYLFRKHTIEKSFVEKYFVMWLAIIPEVLIYVILPLAILGVIVNSMLYGEMQTSYTWIDVLMALLINIGVYWRFGKYFN